MDQSRRLQELGLEVATVSASGPDLDNEEKLEGSYGHVEFRVGDAHDLGVGQLYITTRRLIWVKQGSDQGLAATFLSISLHAIAQTEDGASCIYMQLTQDGSEFSDPEEEDEPEGAEEDGPGLCKELRLIPANSESVLEIFNLLSQCAALNPDDSEDEDEEGEFFYDGEEAIRAGNLDGGMLAHLDSLITMPRADELDQLLEEDPERFDDPEEAQEDHEKEDELMNGHPTQ